MILQKERKRTARRGALFCGKALSDFFLNENGDGFKAGSFDEFGEDWCGDVVGQVCTYDGVKALKFFRDDCVQIEFCGIT